MPVGRESSHSCVVDLKFGLGSAIDRSHLQSVMPERRPDELGQGDRNMRPVGRPVVDPDESLVS